MSQRVGGRAEGSNRTASASSSSSRASHGGGGATADEDDDDEGEMSDDDDDRDSRAGSSNATTTTDERSSSRSRLVEGCRKRVLYFTPSWFSVNMGTGIASVILHNLPYQFEGLNTIATAIFVLNVVLFVLFLGVTVARYAIWPKVLKKMLLHPVQSLYLGTFSMGFGTIGDGIVLFCVPAFGHRFVTLAYACWWIEALVSVFVAIGVNYLMFSRHKNEISGVTAALLLPSVSPIVAAAAGGIVADVLPPSDARLAIIISYFLLGIGLAPALLIKALYVHRLAIYNVPPANVVVSAFLPIGPCGQSAYVFLQLASQIRKLQRETGIALGGAYTPEESLFMSSAISGLSFLIAFFMLGLGFFWLFLALATMIDLRSRGTLPFNMGWWGLVFPLGTMATAAIALAKELDSSAFRVIAMILSLAVVSLWLYVSAWTCVEAFRGTIFVAPCLDESEGVPRRKPKPTSRV